MLVSLFSLLVVATLALAVLGVGRPLAAGFRLDEEDRLTDLVWSFGLGLIAWGWIIAALGLVGQLRWGAILVLTLPAAGWGIGELLAIGLQGGLMPPLDEELEPTTVERRPRVVTLLLFAAGIVLVASCIAALAPPTASDAVAYHLELPKRFLIERGIISTPDIGRPESPLLAEMWYAWALALGGPVAAQLVHWSLGMLLAAASVMLARPIIGRQWCWAVGAVVLLVPGVHREMMSPLDDVALAVMTTLAAGAWWSAVTRGEDRWLVLLGASLGAAMSIRHAGLLFAIAIGVLSIGFVVRRSLPWRVTLQATTTVLVAMLVVVGCWYVRIVWNHGNFLSSLASEAADRHLAPLTMTTLPWQLTMHPEQFSSRAYQLGPLFLMILPGLVLARRLRGLAPLLILAGVYVACWGLACQDARRLLPAVPLLTVGIVWTWHEWRRLPRAALTTVSIVASLIVLASVADAMIPLARTLPVALGLEDREDYLLRHEPTYSTSLITQDLVGREIHILSQDPRAYYFRCRVTPEASYRERTHYDQCRTLLVRHLRSEGFTHVLLAENAADDTIRTEDQLARRLEAEAAQLPSVAPICLSDSTFEGADGPRRYRLYMLR